MIIRRPLMALALICGLAGALLLCQGSYVHLKARLGQWLIAHAWEQTQENGEPHSPWPWMDTWPVAALAVPRVGVRQVVLAGDGGQSLAFAPGHRTGSALPGHPGVTLISGHRDTHFRYLAELDAGDRLRITSAHDGILEYRVSGTRVVGRHTELGLDGNGHLLVLATCWPFNAGLGRADRRYLVIAEPVPPDHSILASNAQ